VKGGGSISTVETRSQWQASQKCRCLDACTDAKTDEKPRTASSIVRTEAYRVIETGRYNHVKMDSLLTYHLY